jgi:hypothetical protein
MVKGNQQSGALSLGLLKDAILPTHTLTPRRCPWRASRTSASRDIPRFLLQPKSSLQYSQEPATCPYPQQHVDWKAQKGSMLWTKEWGLKEVALRILMHAPNICPEEMNIGKKIPPRGYKIFRTTFETIISWRWSAGAYHPRFSVKRCRWKKPWPIASYCFKMWLNARINTPTYNTYDTHKLQRCCNQGVITTNVYNLTW